VTIPEGPRGRKIILDFPDEAETRSWTKRRFRLRSVLTAALLVVSGFLAMALVIKPVILGNKQAATTAAPGQTTVASENQSNPVPPAEQGQTEPMLTHNGVTVVSPHLLVPVLSADAAATADPGAAAADNSNKRVAAKTRIVHRTARATNRRQLTAPWFNQTKRVAGF
jgi:hypothetical protein